MDHESSPVVFEDVAEELSGPLQRYLERLVGIRATADDLLQDTLLKIARALPGFEGRSSVKTWAFTIATRVATDHFRRPQNRAKLVDIDETTHVLRYIIENPVQDFLVQAHYDHDLTGELAGAPDPIAIVTRNRLRQTVA